VGLLKNDAQQNVFWRRQNKLIVLAAKIYILNNWK